MSFSETQAELANLPNFLPNSVKIITPLNVLKLKIKKLISFWNVLNLYCEHFELYLKHFV